MITFLTLYLTIGLLWSLIISFSVKPSTLKDIFMYGAVNVLFWPLTFLLACATIYRQW